MIHFILFVLLLFISRCNNHGSKKRKESNTTEIKIHDRIAFNSQVAILRGRLNLPKNKARYISR